MPLAPATRLGTYEIITPLGEGGMGEVYRARDLRLGRDIALKVLHEGLSGDADHLARLEREARTVAGLNHPNIVTLHSVEDEDGVRFLTMELVEGQSLADLVTPRGLPLDHVLDMGVAIADALSAAHERRVVHRDLKPANVMVTRDGRVKVLDFGIAKVAPPTTTADSQARTPGGALSTTGRVVGTVPYMAPEQILGEPVDARTDLFALGIVLYELLAGRYPFTAPTALAAAAAILNEAPEPLASVRADLPVEVGRIISHCLEKRPADRPQTARDVSNALRVLRSALERGGPAPEPAFGAGPIGRLAPGSLPSPRTPFIGRERELSEGARLLAETRILTVTGVGGTGKTRFAMRLAEEQHAPGGGWFVDLASLTDPDRVLAAVAGSLGIREVAGRELIDLVGEQLRARPALLLVDNCEHLLAACAEVVEALLRRELSVRILATSREPLGVDGERVFELRPLELPDADRSDLASAESSAAVQLFVDRARGAQSDFTLTSTNVGAVLEICRRLDGIPLALELAATRVKVLSVDQIRARLDDRFRLLTGGHRGALPRQQTLRAAIQWSDEQLTPDEQRMFHVLSVFAGGWTLAQAACVAGDDQDEMATIDLLTSLVNKSLVQVDREGDEQRYGLLETVRQYAAERLRESGMAEAVRARHADAFLALAEHAYGERSERGDAWCDVLEADHDNLSTALDHFREADPERYLELAGALAWFWHSRSHFREARAHVTSALERSSATPARAARARAMWGAAPTLAWRGDAAGARRWMEDALRMLRVLGDPREIADALDGIGWTQFASSEDEAAYATFAECLRLQTSIGDPYRITRARVGLAQMAVALDRPAEAEPLARDIIAFAQPRADRRQEHFGWHFLADCALIDGRYAESLELYRKSLVLAQAIADRLETGFEIQGIAMSSAALGNHKLALLLSGAVEEEWERIGADAKVRFWEALLDRHIGAARRALGAEAEGIAKEGRTIPIEEAIAMALSSSGSGPVQ